MNDDGYERLETEAGQEQQYIEFEQQAEEQAMADHINETEAALKVMVLTPHIRGYLAEKDPQALKQAIKALGLSPIESLPSEEVEVMVGAVKVIDICDLMDELVPGWSSEFGAEAYSRAGAAVMEWVNANGAHYYAADREDFSKVAAAFEAERAGKRVVVVEDLS
jgi:hypothetical protein